MYNQKAHMTQSPCGQRKINTGKTEMWLRYVLQP